MNVSFGHTWPALIAKAKDVTRRDWKERTAKWFQPGRQFVCLDKDIRYGGVEVARATVTRCYKQSLADMPEDHYEREGMAWFEDHPLLLPESAHGSVWCPEGVVNRITFDRWRRSGGDVYVLEFEKLMRLSSAVDKLTHLQNEARRRGSDH